MKFLKSILTVCLLLSVSLTLATTHRGTLSLSNWSPEEDAFGPSIESLTMKYVLTDRNDEPEQELYMQWYIGEDFYYKGQKFDLKDFGRDADRISIITLLVQADLYTDGRRAARIEFDLGATPPEGGVWGQKVSYEYDWDELFPKASDNQARDLFSGEVKLKNLRIVEVEFGGIRDIIKELSSKANASQIEEHLSAAKDALGEDDLGLASRHFEKALDLSPDDDMIQRKLDETRYQLFIANGDTALAENAYTYAIAEYQKAEAIYPDKKEASRRIAKVERMMERAEKLEDLLPELEDKVAGQLTEVKGAASEAFQAAIRAVSKEEEAYQLALAEYYACQEENLNTSLEEVELAGEDKLLELAEEGSITIGQDKCDKPERDTRTTRGELDLVDAAKRKFAQAEELDVAAFRVRGLAILDSALSIDPDNGKAWLLKAELSEDVKGSLVALNKARAASADADEVEKIEKSLKADFDKELVSIVKKNDLDLLTEGIKAGFVNGESKINDQTLTEYALERDNARMLGRLMSAAGDSPTARKSSRKMAQALIFPAVAGKKMKTIQLMVDQGAKVDVSNEKGDTPLSLAAKNSDKKVMRLLLDNAGKRTDASAALQIAAQKNEYELMEMILKSKATAKPVDAEGNTLLMKAIADEDNRLFDLLLDNKADVNAANKEGETPLSLAAKAGNESQILRLVEAGSDLEKAFEQLDKDDARALAGQLFSAAIERENEDLIEACLEYDEDLPYREHRSGVSYLTYALDDDKWDLAATMLEATTLSGINKPMDGEYYLLRAVRKEALPVLRVLVSQPQTDMNVQNDDGQSALHMAVEKGNVDLVNLILKGKPELEPRDRAGDTPMHIAIREDQDQIVDALLEMDQRYNASNRRGQTPLHLAIARDKDDIAETLIRSGVDVNASDSNGRTPLHIAVLERNQQMARLLLQNEAIPDAKDVLNRTPLKIARQNKDKAMSAIIREYAPTIFDKVQFWKNEEP